jgi:alpha-1,3/alpha-1,6-mannosyltransferase
VHVHGGWLPRAVFGRLHALLAYARCLLVALAVLCAARDFHVVVLDQVSAPIPLLRAASRAKVRAVASRALQAAPVPVPVARCLSSLHAAVAAQVLFYCHFPDMLLATRASRLRAAYRAPLDALEQTTTGMVRARRTAACCTCV